MVYEVLKTYHLLLLKSKLSLLGEPLSTSAKELEAHAGFEISFEFFS